LSTLEGMADGASPNNWVGKWFHPIVGEQYTVPLNAGNHNAWKGKIGLCREVRSSGFGMLWAYLSEEGGEQAEWVRTCYLTPVP
jgi:hypothetical protein